MMHYWYSAKQASLPHEYYTFVTLSVQGESVEVSYSECSRGPKPFGNWDDYVYLGSTEKDFETVRLVPTGLTEYDCLRAIIEHLAEGEYPE